MTAPEPIPAAPDRAGHPDDVDQHDIPADVLQAAVDEAKAAQG